jgi:hypothetical protein
VTKSSPARVRRKLGRPRKNPTTDPDRLTTEYICALQDPDGPWHLSERAAIDFSIAYFEAEATTPTKIPRGTKGRPGVLIGYENRRPYRSFSGRNSVLRGKLRHARPEIVAVLKLGLRCPDFEVAARLFDALRRLAAVVPPKQVRKLVENLLKSGR